MVSRASGRKGDHGLAGRVGFHRCDSEVFLPRQHERAAGLHQPGHRRVVDAAVEEDCGPAIWRSSSKAGPVPTTSRPMPPWRRPRRLRRPACRGASGRRPAVARRGGRAREARRVDRRMHNRSLYSVGRLDPLANFVAVGEMYMFTRRATGDPSFGIAPMIGVSARRWRSPRCSPPYSQRASA